MTPKYLLATMGAIGTMGTIGTMGAIGTMGTLGIMGTMENVLYNFNPLSLRWSIRLWDKSRKKYQNVEKTSGKLEKSNMTWKIGKIVTLGYKNKEILTKGGNGSIKTGKLEVSGQRLW